MVVLPFPARHAAMDRLTDADQTDLFARWPKGDVIEVETDISAELNCFLATDDSGDYQFVFWLEPDGQYVRQDTLSGRIVKGVTLAEVMPAKPGVSNEG